MNINFNVTSIFVTSIFLFLWACSPDSQKKNAPDVSDITVNTHIRRFEQDLFAIDTNQVAAGVAGLSKKYPGFFQIYTSEIIHDQSNPSETPEQAISSFIRSPFCRNLYDTTQMSFPKLDHLKGDLDKMFQYYQYYFPGKKAPEVITFISEYGTGNFTLGDSLLCIGLDFYLGPQHAGYSYIENLSPVYIRRTLAPDYILPRSAQVLISNELGDLSGTRLLDFLIFNGKMLYAASSLLPQTPDSLFMGYTREKMDGCKANEAELWAKLLEKNLLYSTDMDKWRKLISPSPDASVLFSEAPGEVGNWMGWQIVNAYMERHPGTTLRQLFDLHDSQKLLEASKYKPKRSK